MDRLNRVNRRWALAVAGWLAAALAATAVGVAAVSLLGEGISDSASRPLSADEVRRELARTTPLPTDSATRPPGAGPPQVFNTAGGTVVAGCVGTRATLDSWSPAQGFHSEDEERGPAPIASLKFESDEDELQVEIDCASGQPRLRTATDDGHRGGDDDNSGSGGGGGGGRGPG